jgi:hypothetical protein
MNGRQPNKLCLWVIWTCCCCLHARDGAAHEFYDHEPRGEVQNKKLGVLMWVWKVIQAKILLIRDVLFAQYVYP